MTSTSGTTTSVPVIPLDGISFYQIRKFILELSMPFNFIRELKWWYANFLHFRCPNVSTSEKSRSSITDKQDNEYETVEKSYSDKWRTY